jgi:hypothetical protein
MRTIRSQRLWLTVAIAAAVPCPAAIGPARAAILDQLFPQGVPGYGTDPGVTVQSRIRPDDRPDGVRAGTLIFHPQITTGFGYDSNVLAGTPARGSWLLQAQSSVSFASDWSRNALGGAVAVNDTTYLVLPQQNRVDVSASLGSGIDIGQDRLTLSVAHAARHEDRTHIDALPADKPIFFTLDDARVSYRTKFDRWTLTPSLDVSQWHYDNTTIFGRPASQAYRDRTVIEGAANLSYEIAPLRSLLLVARVTGQGYPNTLPGQPSQDSTSYEVLTGIDYAPDAMWRARLLFGGESRQFAHFASHSAFIAEAELAWMPTGLTTVRAIASRSIEDAAQAGVSGYTYTSAKLTIDHEYMRNLILTASAGLQQASYLQGGQQAGYTAGIGATWLVNRMVQVRATYDLTGLGGGHPAGQPATSAFDRNLALLTLQLGL